MEKVIYDLRLNIKHAGCKQQIELKKGESNARVFRIELSDGTEPIKLNAIDHTAVIRGLKADHTIIYDTASINEGKAEYTLGVQDTAAVGTTWYEVQIIDSGHSDNEKKVLYTAQFKAVVSDEVVDEGTITSSDSFNRLETIINNNQSWLEQAREDIDYRTLVYDSELKLNSSDNTTPDKKHDDFYDADLLRFTTNWFTNDCDFLEIKNNSSNNVCNVYGRNATGNEVYIESVIGTQRINLTEYAEYKLVIVGKGPYDADITKFKFLRYKYVFEVIENIKKQIIKTVRYYSSVKSFVQEMLNMPSDTSLYESIFVIRDSTTPILYTRYIDSTYTNYEYVGNEEFYKSLNPKDDYPTGLKIGYYYISSASEPRTFNYDVLSKVTSVPYTKAEVNQLLNAVNQFNVEIVNVLPTENIDSHTIYFVPKEATDTSDDYDEYIYLGNKWEHIGNTVIDLSNYITMQRKIAGLSLEKDITASELQEKLKDSENYSSDVTQAWLERFEDDVKNNQKFKDAIKEETVDKVDKEDGKSLIANSEIERLKGVKNYDDTDIKKSFDNEIQKIKGTLIKNTVYGSECVINDSADMNIQELHLYGRTEQASTAGSNLFDVNDKLNWNNIFSVDDEDWISAIIPANTGTTDIYYTFNTPKSNLLKPSTTYLAIMEFGIPLLDKLSLMAISPNVGVGNKSQFKGYTSFTKQSVIPNDTNDSFENSDCMCNGHIQAKPGFAGGSVKFRFSLIEDTTMTIDKFRYEPYTGAMPSPNLSHPQEIKSVVNPIVSVAGKNILMPSIPNYSSNATITIQDRVENKIKIKVNKLSTTNTTYIVVTIPITRMIKKIKPNTKYTIILKNPSNITHTFIGLADGGNRITNTVKLTDNRIVLTTISDINNYSTKYPLIFYFTGLAIENVTIGFDDIAVYEGEYSNAEIEQYKPIQSVTINCNFDGIDDIQDELIVQNDGSNKLIQRLVDLQNIQPVIAGLYTKDTKAANTDLVYFYVKKAPRALAKKYGTVKASSNKFRWASPNIWALDEPYVFDVYSAENSDNVRVLFRIKKDDDIDEILKAGINIEYALEEQIVVEDYLSPEEAQEILELNTYKPTTTIWSDQNVDMEIKYIADPKSYIDNKFNELASAIVASASESE